MIGVLTVSLIRLAPTALPDPISIIILAGTLVAQAFKIGVFKLMIGGAILGVLRSRMPALPAFLSTL